MTDYCYADRHLENDAQRKLMRIVAAQLGMNLEVLGVYILTAAQALGCTPPQVLQALAMLCAVQPCRNLDEAEVLGRSYLDKRPDATAMLCWICKRPLEGREAVAIDLPGTSGEKKCCSGCAARMPRAARRQARKGGN